MCSSSSLEEPRKAQKRPSKGKKGLEKAERKGIARLGEGT